MFSYLLGGVGVLGFRICFQGLGFRGDSAGVESGTRGTGGGGGSGKECRSGVQKVVDLRFSKILDPSLQLD